MTEPNDLRGWVEHFIGEGVSWLDATEDPDKDHRSIMLVIAKAEAKLSVARVLMEYQRTFETADVSSIEGLG